MVLEDARRTPGMRCDLGDFIETSYGPSGRVIAFTDRPTYTLETADGSLVAVVDHTIKTITPAEPLPTEPGFYIGDGYRKSPSGRRIVELLNSPAGQWVNHDDSQYLTEWDVKGLRNLKRLVEQEIANRRGTDE